MLNVFLKISCSITCFVFTYRTATEQLICSSLNISLFSGTCGTLYFDRCNYNVGGRALLIYKPLNHSADRQWFKARSNTLQTKSSSKYHEESQEDRFELTIYSIENADAGWYTIICAQGYTTNYAYLNVSASSDDCKYTLKT